MDDKILNNIDEKLTAIVALLAHSIESNRDYDKNERVETLLANVGLSPTRIARLLGKKPDTVIKLINRKNKK